MDRGAECRSEEPSAPMRGSLARRPARASGMLTHGPGWRGGLQGPQSPRRQVPDRRSPGTAPAYRAPENGAFTLPVPGMGEFRRRSVLRPRRPCQLPCPARPSSPPAQLPHLKAGDPRPPSQHKDPVWGHLPKFILCSTLLSLSDTVSWPCSCVTVTPHRAPRLGCCHPRPAHVATERWTGRGDRGSALPPAPTSSATEARSLPTQDSFPSL